MSIKVLHERESPDLYIELFWDSDANRVYVSVHDRARGDAFLIAPDGADALDAFYHPFCYTTVTAGE